jgi:hypothetical protein
VEGKLATDYGVRPDLSSRPWVTYLHWNSGSAYRTLFLPPSGDLEARIMGLFGEPPAKRLSADQLRRYYRDDLSAPEAAVSICALCNAISLKYLVEVTAPWFS